jgi:hypothetical protein
MWEWCQVVLYLKGEAYLRPATAAKLVQDGWGSCIKYAILREDPSRDPCLSESIGGSWWSAESDSILRSFTCGISGRIVPRSPPRARFWKAEQRSCLEPREISG